MAKAETLTGKTMDMAQKWDVYTGVPALVIGLAAPITAPILLPYAAYSGATYVAEGKIKDWAEKKNQTKMSGTVYDRKAA